LASFLRPRSRDCLSLRSAPPLHRTKCVQHLCRRRRHQWSHLHRHRRLRSRLHLLRHRRRWSRHMRRQRSRQPLPPTTPRFTMRKHVPRPTSMHPALGPTSTPHKTSAGNTPPPPLPLPQRILHRRRRLRQRKRTSRRWRALRTTRIPQDTPGHIRHMLLTALRRSRTQPGSCSGKGHTRAQRMPLASPL